MGRVAETDLLRRINRAVQSGDNKFAGGLSHGERASVPMRFRHIQKRIRNEAGGNTVRAELRHSRSTKRNKVPIVSPTEERLARRAQITHLVFEQEEPVAAADSGSSKVAICTYAQAERFWIFASGHLQPSA